MRVQVDDGKAKSAEQQSTSQPQRMANEETIIGYQSFSTRSERQSSTFNFAKNVLLLLAIVATFLACLVFIRDLWAPQDLSSKIPSPEPMISTDLPSPLSLVDEIMQNIDNGIIDSNSGKTDDKDKPVISKTRIIFRINPVSALEPSNEMSLSNPDAPKNLGDILNTLMSNTEPQERQPLFGNFPFFNGPSRSIHPKLIIIRKINPLSSSSNQDEMIKSMLNSVFSKSVPSDISENDDEPMFPFGRSDSYVGPLMSIFPPSEVNPSATGSQPMADSYEKYKNIVDEMATSSKKILSHTNDLKEKVEKEIFKFDDASTLNEANSDEYANKTKDFLASVLANLKKLEVNMKLVDQIINLEKEFVAATNDASYNLTDRIANYNNELNIPLSSIYETSTDLTRWSSFDDKVPESVYSGIVSLGKELINFGKIVFEDVKSLERTLNAPAVEKNEGLAENGEQDSEEDIKTPLESGRIAVFRTSFAPDASEPKNEPVEITDSAKSEN